MDLASIKAGENQKSVVFLFRSTPESYSELVEFLGKITKAVGLDLLKDTCFMGLPEGINLHYNQIKKEFEFKKIIVFGTTPQQLGLLFNCIPYQIINHRSQSFLFADPLSAIFEERQSGGKQMSGKLWKALKEMFNE